MATYPQFTGHLATEKAWYEQIKKIWNQIQHVLSDADKLRWFMLVPQLRLNLRWLLSHQVEETGDWIHWLFFRTRVGIRDAMWTKASGKVKERYPGCDLEGYLPPGYKASGSIRNEDRDLIWFASPVGSEKRKHQENCTWGRNPKSIKVEPGSSDGAEQVQGFGKLLPTGKSQDTQQGSDVISITSREGDFANVLESSTGPSLYDLVKRIEASVRSLESKTEELQSSVDDMHLVLAKQQDVIQQLSQVVNSQTKIIEAQHKRPG